MGHEYAQNTSCEKISEMIGRKQKSQAWWYRAGKGEAGKISAFD